MTSPGKLPSAIVEFVAPLRLWHSLRPINGWFPRRGSSGPARVVGRSRENGKRSFRDVQAMFKRVRAPEEEKRAGASLARHFKQSVFFGHPQRRLVQSERRYGAEPRLPGWFLQGIFNGEKNNF